MRYQPAFIADILPSWLQPQPKCAVIDDVLAGRIRLAQLAPILKFTPVLMAVNIMNAAIVCATSGVHPAHGLIDLWGGAIALYGILALIGWVRSKRRNSLKTTVSHRGHRRFVTQAALLGCLWGVLPVVVIPQADASLRILIVALVAGMIGCGSFAMLTLPAAAIAYTAPIFIGALYGLLASRDPTLLTLSALLVFCYATITSSCLFHGRTFYNRLISTGDLQRQTRGVSTTLSDFEAAANDWLWEVDAEGVLTYVSQRMAAAVGVTRDVLTGVPLTTLCRAPANDPSASGGSIESLIGARAAFADVIVAVRVGEALRTWSLSGKPIQDADGRHRGFRGIGADVTAARDAQRRIAELAHFDPLTELPNRTSFLQALRAVPLSEPEQGGCAVMCLDLDNFQTINDSLSHRVGDAVLIEAAQRLRDVVGDLGSVARLDGDEFVVLLAPSPPVEAVRALAARILADLSRAFAVDGHVVQIGASIGGAIAPRDAQDPDALLKNADLALYRSKSEGKGVFSFFEPAMNVSAQERRALEVDLRGALANGELLLFYQPLIDSDTHQITGFEALIRWRHPRRGLVAPIDFIPWAEKWGLITKIGEWVLHEACKNAAAWPADMTVAVNLSPIQFIGDDLYNHITSALSASGLDPGRLELEITEGLLLNETERTIAQLARLKTLGVKIAMDDFGTGYSSLAYLWKFPFDKIKIDRSFVAEMHHNGAIIDILRTITALGRNLKLKVTAEGVETLDQVRVLTAMHCDNFQGYLFGRPMPVEEVPAFILSDLARRRHDEEGHKTQTRYAATRG